MSVLNQFKKVSMKTLVQQTIFDVNDKNRHKEVEHTKQYHVAVITSTFTICVHFI